MPIGPWEALVPLLLFWLLTSFFKILTKVVLDTSTCSLAWGRPRDEYLARCTNFYNDRSKTISCCPQWWLVVCHTSTHCKGLILHPLCEVGHHYEDEFCAAHSQWHQNNNAYLPCSMGAKLSDNLWLNPLQPVDIQEECKCLVAEGLPTLHHERDKAAFRRNSSLWNLKGR